MKEEWRNLRLKHFEHFQVSNQGRVRNSKTGHEIAQGDNGRGYVNIKLKARPYSTTTYAHRLVAMEFLDDFDPDLEVNHKDKNKRNNAVSNLEMVTGSENKYWSRDEYVAGHIKTQGKIVQVCDLDGNVLFESEGLWETCRKYGFDPRAVQRVIKGVHRCHKGYTFKYKQ